MEQKKYTLEVGERMLEAEFGLLAGQASGSVTVRYGDTVVLATATMSKFRREGMDYFPLLVDYEERYYAGGKIKGSRFIKREGRPSDKAILNGRIIDRTIRPLFDERMRNEVQVVVTVLSIDKENDPVFTSIIGASLALGVSNIPWNGPVGAVRIGINEEQLKINPVNGDLENIRDITRVTRKLKTHSFCFSKQCVEQGVSFGITLEANKPKMFINLKSAKAEGSNYSAKILSLCERVNP